MTQEILSVFEKQMRLKGLAKNTIKGYTQAIKDYLLFSQDFIQHDVAEYLNRLKKRVDNRHVSRSHYNQVQYAFDKFWQIFYGKRFPLLQHIEVPVIPPKIPSEQDVSDAIQKTTRRQHKIILCLAYFGMLRRAEIWHLDLYKDFDYRNNAIVIRAGKGWKPRLVPLDDFTKSLCLDEISERRALRDQNPWVCAKQGTADRYLCYSEIGQIVNDAGRLVGYNDWHPHLLRHTGATHLDAQKVSTRQIQMIEGHSRIQTTQVYIHPRQDDVMNVRNKLSLMLLNNNDSSKYQRRNGNNG